MKEIKDGEVRRREILLAARTLFVTKGYDKTSINDILKVVDIAKGTFYYYFKSKEEVLKTIIMDIVDEGARKARDILNNQTTPIITRIVMAMMAQKPEFEGSSEIALELHKVENTKLHQMYVEKMLQRMTEELKPIVYEGIEQGVLVMDYPEECIEQLLLLGHMLFDSNTFAWSMEQYPKKIQAFISTMEKVLGTSKGELVGLLALFQSQ